ncbi:MAG TPA: SH3 domain-containing protein, partial [Thermomicrobiales bacterium]|nr:SH3 domain-containing protein [Thermomicrobiales bacterium]
TPAGEAATDLSTPVEEDDPGTESGPVPTAAAFTGSDGTSGATPISLPRNDGSVATPATGEGTPEGTPGLAVLEETRTSDTVDLTAIDPVSVDSCSPDNVPILIDGNASFVTNSSVNFRSGPGADCDAIGNGPLGAGIPVLVTSAPVDREGDEYVWVQITVNDIVGWVVIESLDPA